MLYRVLKRNSLIVNLENTVNDRIRPSALYNVVSSHSGKQTKLELLKWRPSQVTPASTVVTVRTISELEFLMKSRLSLPIRNKVVILSTYPPVPGLKSFVKEWRKETEQDIYLVSVAEEENMEQLPEIHLAYSVLHQVSHKDFMRSCYDFFAHVYLLFYSTGCLGW